MFSPNPGNPSPFTSYQQQFHQALSDEIQSLRKLGGQTTTIADGRHLGKRDGKHLYSFTTDTEIRLSDDTPDDLVHQRKRYPGVLLSIKSRDAKTKRMRVIFSAKLFSGSSNFIPRLFKSTPTYASN